MPLVYAGVCSHAPGITGRKHLADPDISDAFYAAFDDMRVDLEASGAEAVVIIAAEHFANFFMNNMPSFAIGMADFYDGPIEDPGWLGIDKFRAPGNRDLSQRLIAEVMQTVDVAYAEEWLFDHGIAVPLHFLTPRFDVPVIPVNINCQGPPLTPLPRAWALGEALRRAADAVPETLDRTNLGALGPGDPVNLERPLAANGRYGGHVVQGHVDGTGEVQSIEELDDGSYRYTFSLPPELASYVVEKGSIAIDGISLTVADVSPTSFSIAIIPHTHAVTAMGQRQVGDTVNLEADVLAKYVERLVRPSL